jgi:hypothetical protein
MKEWGPWPKTLRAQTRPHTSPSPSPTSPHWRALSPASRSSGGTTGRTRSTATPPAGRCTRSTLPRPRRRVRSTSATCSPTRRPTSLPASSACAGRTCSTPWAGTTTACPPSAASRTTSRALRPPRSPTTRTTPRRRSPQNQRDFDAVSRRNFIELCEEVAVEDEKVFEDLFSTLGLSVDWNLTYRTIDDTSRAVSQRAFLTNLAAGDAYLAEGADPVGRHLPHRRRAGRARGPRAARRLPPHRPSTSRDGSRCSLETDPPELLPRAWRWWPTRTTSATSRCSAQPSPPPVRRRGRDQGPPAGQARQGQRHRDDLHLRRPHRRHLVARTAASHPRRRRPRRAHPG